MRPRLGRLTLLQRERLTGFFGWFIDIARGAAPRPLKACRTGLSNYGRLVLMRYKSL